MLTKAEAQMDERIARVRAHRFRAEENAHRANALEQADPAAVLASHSAARVCDHVAVTLESYADWAKNAAEVAER